MRKTLIFLFLLFILLTTDVQAQGPIYLPLIFGNGEYTMSGLATLEITDGTTTINLLTKEGQTGFHLVSWRPQIIQPKSGGIYQDSDIAPGRDLVFAVDGTANEIFNTHLAGKGQNELIQTAQDLLRLLTKARNYSLSEWQDTPVYIKAQASCEDSPRYALIKNFTIQDVDNPFGQSFNPTANQLVAMQNIAIGIERGHWCGSLIGTGACAETSSVQEWLYNNKWSVVSDEIGAFYYGLLQTTTNKILVGANENIYRSIDDGLTWAVAQNISPNTSYSLLQTTTGKIISGENGRAEKSTDDGVTFTPIAGFAPAGNINILLQTSSGAILAGELTQIWRSTDDGVNWVAVFAPGFTFWSMIQTSSGRILAAASNRLYQSVDNGLTWALVTTVIPSAPYLIQLSSDNILVGGQLSPGVTGEIWQSTDDGLSWAKITTTTGIAGAFLQTSSGMILNGMSSDLLYSNNYGFDWYVLTTLPTAGSVSIIETVSGAIIESTLSEVIRLPSDTSNMGRANTCLNETYISNKQNVANLTNIYINDGGVFSANLFPMVLPTTLLPAVPVVNDAIYFGIDTTISNTGPFSSLIFDIITPASSTTSYTIIWEYSNGAAGWPALTVRDGTNAGIGALSNLGVNSVHWTPQSQ